VALPSPFRGVSFFSFEMSEVRSLTAAMSFFFCRRRRQIAQCFHQDRAARRLPSHPECSSLFPIARKVARLTASELVVFFFFLSKTRNPAVTGKPGPFSGVKKVSFFYARCRVSASTILFLARMYSIPLFWRSPFSSSTATVLLPRASKKTYPLHQFLCKEEILA